MLTEARIMFSMPIRGTVIGLHGTSPMALKDQLPELSLPATSFPFV